MLLLKNDKLLFLPKKCLIMYVMINTTEYINNTYLSRHWPTSLKRHTFMADNYIAVLLVLIKLLYCKFFVYFPTRASSCYWKLLQRFYKDITRVRKCTPCLPRVFDLCGSISLERAKLIINNFVYINRFLYFIYYTLKYYLYVLLNNFKKY